MVRRTPALLVAALLVVLACLPGPAGHASAATPTPATHEPRSAADACEAFQVTDPEAVLARASEVSDVFVGRVRSAAAERGTRDRRSGLEPTRTASGTDGDADREGWRHEVTVEVRLHGDLRIGQAVAVRTGPASSEGLGRLEEGRTYLFFADASESPDRLTASRCGGTTILAGGLDAALERELKQIFDREPEASPVTVTLSEPAGGADEPPSLGRATAPGAALGLLGVLGLLLLWRVGRSSS